MTEDHLLPPWERFPDSYEQGIPWVNDPEQQYWFEWGKWYTAMTPWERSQYRTAHPEPPQLNGTYERTEKIFGKFRSP